MRSCLSSLAMGFMLHVALIVDLHLCYRMYLQLEAALRGVCKATPISGYFSGFITIMKIDIRLVLGLGRGCLLSAVSSPGQVNPHICGLMLRLGCRNNLFLLPGLCKAAWGHISTLNAAAGTRNVNMQNTWASMCQVSNLLMSLPVCVFYMCLFACV